MSRAQRRMLFIPPLLVASIPIGMGAWAWGGFGLWLAVDLVLLAAGSALGAWIVQAIVDE